MSNPLVSVIMIVRNGQRTLPLALASLLRQTYENWECICIDDASSDDSRQLLGSLADSRFKLVCSDTPLGRGRARSLALKHISGEYVATLDCDDFYLKHTLKSHVDILNREPQLTATIGQFLIIDQQESLLGRPRRKLRAGPQFIPRKPQELQLPFGAMVFRTSAIGELDYDPNLERSEDRGFFSKLLSEAHILILSGPTYVYRRQLEFHTVQQGLLGREFVYTSHLKHHPLSAFYLIAKNRFKILAYTILYRLGLWDTLNRRRIRRASESDSNLYCRELSQVRKSASLFL